MLQCHATSLALNAHVSVAAATLRGPYYSDHAVKLENLHCTCYFPLLQQLEAKILKLN